MKEYFDIFGTEIKVSEIKEFRIVQKEYIYRPTYVEEEKSLKNALTGKRIKFFGMQPYAAIDGGGKNQLATSEYKAKDFKESVGKDLVEGVITSIGDKFNIKTIKSVKYQCVNQAGRRFTTYLEDVPALLMRVDGKASDIRKDDELYFKLGEPIAPAINIVPALVIRTKEQDFIFYGNGIQLQDIQADYVRLKTTMDEFRETKQSEKKSLSSFIPKINLPKKKEQPALPQNGSVLESALMELKTKLKNGELSEEQYREKVDGLIEKM